MQLQSLGLTRLFFPFLLWWMGEMGREVRGARAILTVELVERI